MNARAKAAIHMECDNREFSLKLKLPAYGVTVFGCTPEKVDVKNTYKYKGIDDHGNWTRRETVPADDTEEPIRVVRSIIYYD